MESSRVREPREDCSAIWLAVLGDGAASGLSLSNQSDSGSFLVVSITQAKRGFIEEDSKGRLVDIQTGCLLFLLTFLQFFQLVVAC